MPSLKDLRVRIVSVKSTQRITSAMKMVAAAKLRRAQERAEEARPFAERMERVLSAVAGSVADGAGAPPLLAGTGKDQTHLIVLVSSDRGLCGGFNTNLVRFVRSHARQLTSEGKTVQLFCVGRKGYGQLRGEFGDNVVEVREDVAKPAPSFGPARDIAAQLASMYKDGAFDVCTVVYNKFVSVMTQDVTPLQLIPFAVDDVKASEAEAQGGQAVYEYEPSEEQILAELLPRNLAVQMYRAILESFASEQASRMTAMDNATRNAGEMIDELTTNYNRTRQAFITKELIEIISGAEAL